MKNILLATLLIAGVSISNSLFAATSPELRIENNQVVVYKDATKTDTLTSRGNVSTIDSESRVAICGDGTFQKFPKPAPKGAVVAYSIIGQQLERFAYVEKNSFPCDNETPGSIEVFVYDLQNGGKLHSLSKYMEKNVRFHFWLPSHAYPGRYYVWTDGNIHIEIPLPESPNCPNGSIGVPGAQDYQCLSAKEFKKTGAKIVGKNLDLTIRPKLLLTNKY